MKQFIFCNWYKLSMAFAALVFSFGFAIWAVKYNPAKAGEPNINSVNAENQEYVVAAGTKIYRVFFPLHGNKWIVQHIGDAK